MKKFYFFMLFLCILPLSLKGKEKEIRRFRFTYSLEVKTPEKGKKIRIWFPIPQNSRFQEVKEKKLTIMAGKEKLVLPSLKPDFKFHLKPKSKKEVKILVQIQREKKYQNLYGFVEILGVKGRTYRLVLDCLVERRKVSALAHPSSKKKNLTKEEIQKFLAPNQKVPVGHPKIISHIQEALGKNFRKHTSSSDPKIALKKARRIYDYIYDQLKYDKSGFGWGRGDALWACDHKRGNCTDFHSLFISMMRTLKIPARFEIGFPLPENKNQGLIHGYHCWGWFYIQGIGWIPVDISEADKHPNKKEFFFGSLDAHRIGFTVGRDLELSPAPKHHPINFFIYPIVEVDGALYKFQRKFTFRNTEN